MRLGILGCGAVTEILHLPGARQVSGIEVTVLVDRDLARARELADRFGARSARASYDRLDRSEVDAVLIALPNRLHAEASIECLSRGLHVLVEKPMALSSDEAREMICTASAAEAVLQVAMSKRFAKGAQLVRGLIAAGTLGELRSFTVNWGVQFDWPLVSDAGMAADQAGGGVLADFGSHFIDLLCWWLGTPQLGSYADDARGGVEADCEMELWMAGPAGRIPGTATFSRLRGLDNAVRIHGERLTVEWRHETPDAVRLLPRGWVGESPSFAWQGSTPQTHVDMFADQLRAFVHSVDSGESAVPGGSVLPGLELIEQCYDVRRTMRQPWEQPVVVPGESMVGA